MEAAPMTCGITGTASVEHFSILTGQDRIIERPDLNDSFRIVQEHSGLLELIVHQPFPGPLPTQLRCQLLLSQGRV